MTAPLFDPAAPRKELRPHQVEAIDRLRDAFREGDRRVVVQMATGAGKTLTAGRIIEGALAKGRSVIFTVPALALVGQTVEAFHDEGITDVGVMQARHPLTNPLARVQIATVQTLARRQLPSEPSLVIVDECHTRSIAIERLMTEDATDAFFVGLSATPWARGMGQTWQRLIVGATTADLIEAGFLCPFRAYAPTTPDLEGVRTQAGDYREDDLASRLNKTEIVGDVVQTWLERGEGRPTLAFAVNRAHARALHERFEAAGVASAYVDMTTDRIERGLIERRFRSGEISVACSVRTLTTGVDWPVACIIDAAPTKSEMLHVQKIGRGLRVNPPWEDCLILDHAGNSIRLGLVTDIHHDELDDGTAPSASKSKSPDAEEERLPKVCPKCAAVVERGRVDCQECGHEIRRPTKVVEREGALSRVGGAKEEAKPSPEEVSRFLRMAVWVDRERGRAGKLALALFRTRFGRWPDGPIDEVHGLPPDAAFSHWETAQRRAYAVRQRKAAEAAARRQNGGGGRNVQS